MYCGVLTANSFPSARWLVFQPQTHPGAHCFCHVMDRSERLTPAAQDHRLVMVSWHSGYAARDRVDGMREVSLEPVRRHI